MKTSIYKLAIGSELVGIAVNLYAATRHRERRLRIWRFVLSTGLSAGAVAPSMNLLQLALKYLSRKVEVNAAPAPTYRHGRTMVKAATECRGQCCTYLCRNLEGHLI